MALISAAFLPQATHSPRVNSTDAIAAASSTEDLAREEQERASRSQERQAPQDAAPAQEEPAPAPAAVEPPPPPVDVWDANPPVIAPMAYLGPEQMENASRIVWEGGRMGLATQAKVIAIATALQETNLLNLANDNVPSSKTVANQGVGYDHDSVGLFQQRPLWPEGQGHWGRVWELMTPAIAAQKFYQALIGIDQWWNMPVSVAAQNVQVSAFPDAYAKHEGLARQIVAACEAATPQLTNG